MNIFDLAAKISLDTSEFDRGIKNAGGKMISFSKGTGKFVKRFTTVVTAALGTISGFAIKTGMSFEGQMSKVAAISGATAQEFEKLSEKAKELGRNTKFSASEAGEAFEYMAMAGWKTSEMLNGITGVMDLAAASGENLGIVSDIVTDSMTAFGLSADKSAHFADVLAAASSNSNTNIAMMGETFKYAAPLAGALGYTIEDTAVAIGLMANAGIKSSQAGTSLRSMFTRLAKPTKEVNKAFEKLGYTTENILTDSNGGMKPFSEVLEDLRKRFSNLSEVEKAETAAMLAGQEAMSGMLAIINTSDEDFNALTNAIQNADGAAKNMAKTMENNLQGQITKMKSALEGFAITFFEKVSPTLTKFTAKATETVSKLTKTFEDDGTDGLIKAITEMLKNSVISFSEQLPATIERIVKFIKREFPKFRETAIDLIHTINNALIKSIPILLEASQSIINDLAKFLKDPAELHKFLDTAFTIVSQIGLFIIQNVPLLIDVAINLIESFASYILDPKNIKKLLQTGVDIVVAIINGLFESIPKLIEGAGTLISNIFQTFKETDWLKLGRDIVQGIKDGISEKWQELKNWFNNLWDDLTGVTDLEIERRASVSAGSSSYLQGGASTITTDYASQVKQSQTKSEPKPKSETKPRNVNINQYINSKPQTPSELASTTRSYFEGARFTVAY